MHAHPLHTPPHCKLQEDGQTDDALHWWRRGGKMGDVEGMLKQGLSLYEGTSGAWRRCCVPCLPPLLLCVTCGAPSWCGG